MATTTTRLGLTKPDYSDNVDVDDLNDNMDDLDAVAGAVMVTSSTRPASPFDGEFIFEKDTSASYVYSADAVDWVAVGGSGGGTSFVPSFLLMGA
jgi:hypothetical protein